MAEIVIKVENVSKRYSIRHRSNTEHYSTLRDTMVRGASSFISNIFRRAPGVKTARGANIEEFWALRNVSFEVRRGEVVGIIGRNGAGKSTLLKLLSRITEPTQGRVTLYGRVASLLEVGTGFHQELTGRENIFLNGAILGMERREIQRKFDEIVAFAEVERFLDTPVKRYSSGMYVRLAFAVAAHLDPDILLVDEVLAVGDAEFQKKCLGKIQDASRHDGRTVLFVSHNLGAVASLAGKGIFLQSGAIEAQGPMHDVLSNYLSRGASPETYLASVSHASDRPHVRKIEVATSEHNGVHEYGRRLDVKIWISHREPMRKACFSLNIVNQFQCSVVHAWAFNPEHSYGATPGETVLICTFPSLRLNVGQYYIRTHLAEPPGMEIYEKLDGICRFEVVRTADSIFWGWNPDHCVYHESWKWLIDPDLGGDSKPNYPDLSSPAAEVVVTRTKKNDRE